MAELTQADKDAIAFHLANDYCRYKCFKSDRGCDFPYGSPYDDAHDEIHGLQPVEADDDLVAVCIDNCQANAGPGDGQEFCEISDHVCFTVRFDSCAHCDGPGVVVPWGLYAEVFGEDEESEDEE